MCVCVCVRARACVCVCACVCHNHKRRVPLAHVFKTQSKLRHLAHPSSHEGRKSRLVVTARTDPVSKTPEVFGVLDLCALVMSLD